MVEEMDPNCDMGYWDIGREEWEYDFEMQEWEDWDYFYECESHNDCDWGEMACAIHWRGNDYDMWEAGQKCIDWSDCDTTITNAGEWIYIDCWADGRFESAMKATLSMAAGLVVLAYAM